LEKRNSYWSLVIGHSSFISRITNYELRITNYILLFATLFPHSFSFSETKQNILSHSAFIKIFPTEKTISVIDTLIVVSSESEIFLRLFPTYEIVNSSLNGKPTIPLRDGMMLQIRDVLSDTNTIIVEYSGEVLSTEMSQLNDTSAVLREEEILPQGEHNYQFANIKLQVPNGWEAIASGQLTTKETESDSTIFFWRTNTPIPSLGWFVAGKFSVAKTFFDSIEISTYFTSVDTSIVEKNARAEKIHSLCKNVLKTYSEKFGTYRFSKLAIIEVEDFLAGKNVVAAAIPSGVLMKKFSFTTNDSFNSAIEVLPHEIAHQWFPQTIFVEDEDLAILSEGLCEYAARLFHETTGDRSIRDDLSNHPLLRSLLIRAQNNQEVPLQKKADLRTIPTQYLKAYYFHHMLRTIIGDDVFMKLLKEYCDKFWLKKTSLNDFKKLAEELSEKNLDWFFDQWVKNTGIPRLKLYNVKTIFENGRWKTKGNVRIVGYAQFTTPVKVEVRTQNDSLVKNLWLGKDSTEKYQNDVAFEIFSKEKPTEVVLNPRGDILLSKKMPPRLSDLREPSDGTMIIGSNGNTDSLWTMARRDSAEMDKGGWWITMKVDSSITLGDLQQERVILYGTKEQNSVVEKFVKNFPIIFHNDSCFYRDSSWSGDSLGVTQIIDNPFHPNGLVVWVVPLGNSSVMQLLPFPNSYIIFNGSEHEAEGVWEIEDEEYIFKIKN